VIVARPDLTILDTRAMAWMDHPALDRVQQKVLARDSGGQPSVSLLWYPPGAPRGDVVAERHYHRTVHEQVLVLSGEQPSWEYEHHGGRQGDCFHLREGYFVDRVPGALHGFEPGAVSRVGCVFLVIQDGPGLHAGEAGYQEETISVPLR
jgi:hypothetical protein